MIRYLINGAGNEAGDVLAVAKDLRERVREARGDLDGRERNLANGVAGRGRWETKRGCVCRCGGCECVSATGIRCTREEGGSRGETFPFRGTHSEYHVCALENPKQSHPTTKRSKREIGQKVWRRLVWLSAHILPLDKAENVLRLVEVDALLDLEDVRVQCPG